MSVGIKERRLREIGSCWRCGLGWVPPVLNRPWWRNLTSRQGVKEVELSMGCPGTEGTDNSLACVVSLGPHSHPVRAGTVRINIKLRLKLSRLRAPGNGGIQVSGARCSWLTGQMSLCDCVRGNLPRPVSGPPCLSPACVCQPEGGGCLSLTCISRVPTSSLLLVICVSIE